MYNRYYFVSKIQKIILYIFFFSINFEVWDPFHVGGWFSVSKLTGLLYLFVLLPNLKYFLTIEKIGYLFTFIWTFFVLLTLSGMINVAPLYSNFFDFTLFQNLILMLLLINHERYEELVLEKAMFSFAIGSFCLAMLYIFGYGVEYNQGRVEVFGDNENIIGIRMAISITIMFMMYKQNVLNIGRYKFLLLFTLPFMLNLLAETGSRSAFISFMLIFSYGIILYKATNIRYKIFSLLVGSISFYYVLDYLLKFEVLSSRITNTVSTGDSSGREYIWRKLIYLIEDNYLIGVGKTGYAEYSYNVFNYLVSPHNVILEILCYSGVLGLIFFILFLSNVVIRSCLIFKYDGYLSPHILLIPVFILILSGQMLEVKICWCIFGYIIGRSLSYVERDSLLIVFK